MERGRRHERRTVFEDDDRMHLEPDAGRIAREGLAPEQAVRTDASIRPNQDLLAIDEDGQGGVAAVGQVLSALPNP